MDKTVSSFIKSCAISQTSSLALSATQSTSSIFLFFFFFLVKVASVTYSELISYSAMMKSKRTFLGAENEHCGIDVMLLESAFVFSVIHSFIKYMLRIKYVATQYLHQFFRAGITEYHRRGVLNYINLLLQFWILKVQDKESANVVSSETYLLGFQIAAFLLCLHEVFSVPVHPW